MKKKHNWFPGWGWAALSAASGGLSAMGYPPYDIWPLALLGLVPLGFVIYRLPPRQSFLAGFMHGLAQWAFLMHWIMVPLTVYGRLVYPLALGALAILVSYLACYTAFFCLVSSRLRVARFSPLYAAPFVWAGLEWVREWAFTGFSWLPLSSALSSEPVLIQSAEIWGGRGISALMVLLAMLVARAHKKGLSRPGRHEQAAIAMVVIILVSGWVWGSFRMNQVAELGKAAPQLRVTVVQGNIPFFDMWTPARHPHVIRRYLALSRLAMKAGQGRPELLVWSESAAPFYFLNEARPSQLALEGARELGVDILINTLGMFKEDGKIRPTNRSWLLTAGGKPGEYYDKVHLVPFGEYVPWEPVLFFVRALAVISENFVPGKIGHTLKADGAVIAPLICYESIYTDLARAQKNSGARLLINQTNDAWFGRTGASAQHMSHLALRSVETRLACARAANTGISGFVMPDGVMTDMTRLFIAAFRTKSLPLIEQKTIYQGLGDLAGPGGAALSLILLIAAARRHKEQDHV